jgi:hypothetical protein
LFARGRGGTAPSALRILAIRFVQIYVGNGFARIDYMILPKSKGTKVDVSPNPYAGSDGLEPHC